MRQRQRALLGLQGLFFVRCISGASVSSRRRQSVPVPECPFLIDRDVSLRQTAVLCVALALTGLASNVGGLRNTSIRRASAAA